MEKKNIVIITIIAIIIVIGGVVTFVSLSNDSTSLKDIGLVKSEYLINFYSDGSQAESIESEVEKLKTNPYLKDEVNNDTVKWIEGFDNNEYVYIITTNKYNLLMKRSDYDALKSEINTSGLTHDEFIVATIKANIVETHSLGSGGYKDVVYINNIELTGTKNDKI